MMNYMTKPDEYEIKKFYCHLCGEEAMFMDVEKKWWCYFNWKDFKEHHGICKKQNKSK